MEDRKTALAVFLCIVVVLVYSEVVLAPVTRPPSKTETSTTSEDQARVSAGQQNAGRQKRDTKTDSLATGANSSGDTSSPDELSSNSEGIRDGIPTAAEIEEAGLVRVRTPQFVMAISNLGGRIKSFRLTDQKVTLDSKKLLDLVDFQENVELPLSVTAGGYSDTWVEYSLDASTAGVQKKQKTFLLEKDQELNLLFTGTFPNGATITKQFKVKGDFHAFDLNVSLSKATADKSNIWIDWPSFLSPEDLGSQFDPRNFTRLSDEKEYDTTAATEIEEGITNVGKMRWLAFGDKYFMTAILSANEFSNMRRGKTGDVFSLGLEGSTTEAKAKFFVGPKEYKELQRFGYQLHRTVDLGIFAFLAHPLLELIRFFYSFLGNYGLAIVLLTLLIKALFLPLTSASFRSMKAMQDLQPEMKALRERVKDPTQLNQEMMALYKSRGVNPMGGCFPMLIQLPVFLGLYNGLLYSIELRHAPFALWVTDLSTPESLDILGVPVPVMIIIMGLSMVWQQWTTPSGMDPQQKKVMMLMPVIFTGMFIIFPFPAGLVLYWLVNNLISIVQQSYLRSEKEVSPLKATAVASVGIFFGCYVLTLL